MNVDGVFFILVCFCIYMIPTIIGRKKRNYVAIAALNILAGWTIIGWIIALTWALTVEPEAKP